MASSSKNSIATTIHRTLLASTVYELIHAGELTILMMYLPKKEASIFALIICSITLTSKFIDAGAGTSMPRLLKDPVVKNSLIRVLWIQFFFTMLIIITGLILLGRVNAEYMCIILLAATCEAIASVGRHAIYSTLQSKALMITEVLIKAIKFSSLLLLFYLLGNSNASFIITHFIVFLLINTVAIMWLAQQICLKSLMQPTTWHQHSIVLKQRMQVFSTKFCKDLLSSYALTPLFAYTFGIEHTWLFYFCTSIITSLRTNIKMAVSYTAAGIFQATLATSIQTLINRLNVVLFSLIITTLGIINLGYTLIPKYFMLSTGEIQAARYITCFATLALIDLSTIVYEQYLLISGYYYIYQFLHLAEYAVIAVSIAILGKKFPVNTITFILICIKIITHLALRARARSLTKPPPLPPLCKFSQYSHPHFPYTLFTPKSPQTPKLQRKRRQWGGRSLTSLQNLG